MRKLKINGCTFDSIYAEKFIEAGHRKTNKVRPHFISITFNSGSLNDKRIGKEVDYLLDLLTQAFIIKNPIDKLLIDINKKQTDQILIDIA